MQAVTSGAFEVKEQSLYRALRRFSKMGLLKTSLQESPNRGPQLKYYELTQDGEEVLRRFVALNIAPLFEPKVASILQALKKEGINNEQTTPK